MERTRPKSLGPEETQTVLRRAAELDRRHAPQPAPDEPPRLDEQDLERAATESGLSRESLRRALLELEGGGLARPQAAPALHRLVAADEVTAERTIDAPPAVVEERLARTLQQNGLRPAGNAAHATQWEPAQGLGNALSRAVDRGGTGIWIGAAIESGVHAVPGDRTSAELRGHAKELATPIATVTGLLLSFPAGIALLVVLAFGLRWGFSAQQALAACAVVFAWFALTAAIARGVSRRRVRKLRRALERMLDQVAA